VKTSAKESFLRILRILGIIARVSLGLPLLFATALVSAFFFAAAITGAVINRFGAGLLGFFFLVQACAIWKILLIRKNEYRLPMIRLPLPPRDDPGFEEALVPAPRKPKPPTLSAAADIPREGMA
jgi:hypothetical protein